MNSYSDHPVLNAIFDDEVTEPFISLVSIQIQLNSAESVMNSFTARAQFSGYATNVPNRWNDEEELVVQIENEDIIYCEEDA